MELEASRGNVDGDPFESITYTEARANDAFPKFFFLFGKWYEFTYENGAKVRLKRNNERLYSGKIQFETGLEYVPKGPKSSVVVHKIVSIREI